MLSKLDLDCMFYLKSVIIILIKLMNKKYLQVLIVDKGLK